MSTDNELDSQAGKVASVIGLRIRILTGLKIIHSFKTYRTKTLNYSIANLGVSN